MIAFSGKGKSSFNVYKGDKVKIKRVKKIVKSINTFLEK